MTSVSVGIPGMRFSKGKLKASYRDILWKLTAGHCWYCGNFTKAEDRSLDHIIPRSQGGKNIGNLAPSCFNCNKKKADLSVESFRALLMRYEHSPMHDGVFAFEREGWVLPTPSANLVGHYTGKNGERCTVRADPSDLTFRQCSVRCGWHDAEHRFTTFTRIVDVDEVYRQIKNGALTPYEGD